MDQQEPLSQSTIQAGAPDFAIRGLELHSNARFQTGMWHWKNLDRVFDLMEQLELNALIFHQIDLQDWLVWPQAYFTPEIMRARWPLRRANIQNAKSHIREVVKRAAQRGIGFYLEVKEMAYPDELIELHPELMVIKGVVCPTHPFWWEYERAKYRELLDEIPGIAGVIMSPGSRESKLSLSVHNCTCDRCRSYDPALWYSNIIRSNYEPLAARGKRFVVRDFAFSRADQNLVVDACTRVSRDIVAAMKNTPHDYYPTFPDNPRIGHTDGHPQWVEFDTWGQFNGMGFFPVSLVEDMQRRLRYGKKNGVTGVWFRADLEVVSDTSVFNSFNLLNMFGGGLLSRRIEQDLDNVYQAWLSHGILDPLKAESEETDAVPVQPADRGRFRDFMRASWSVVEKTLYVRGHVWTDGSCQFPITVDRAFFNMLVFQGRDDWEPGSSRRVEPTPENLEIIFAEKEQAEREVERLPEILKIGEARLPAGLKASVNTMLELYRWYVHGFRLCTVACFTARRAGQTRAAADVQAAVAAGGAVALYRNETARRLKDTYFPHTVYWFFDLDNLDQLTADIREKMAALSDRHPAA
ncbi:MAG: hypothetical protein ABSA05_00545 [Opitutaceae bacterium]